MSISTGVAFNDDFIGYYNAISCAMVAKDSLWDKQRKQIIEEFEEFGLDTVKKGELLSQLYAQVILQYNKDASAAALSVMDKEMEKPTKDAQKSLIDRQRQGYDDNLLVKVSEFKGGLSSFAVNAGSDSAQNTIDDFKCSTDQLKSRSEVLPGEVVCTTTGSVQIPTNFIVSSVTYDTINLSWDAVADATSYKLYKDGALWQTIGTLTAADTGLGDGESHSYNIKAVVGASESSLSSTIVGTTTEYAKPSPVTNLASSGETATTADLTWTEDVNGISYDVYVDNVFNKNATGNSTQLTGLTASTSYVVALKTKGDGGYVSGYSDSIVVTTTA